MVSRINKRHIILMTLFGLLAIGIIIFATGPNKETTVIRHYDDKKDFEALVPIIRDNMYWISERPDFSPEKFLMWRAPNFDPARKGEATIDVIEVDKQPAGFIAYYKKSPTHGYIWIFAVGENFRRRGLGDKLMAHALKQLKSQGSQYVTLNTRLQKTPALKLYEKAGFVELSREEDRGMITLIKRFH